MIGVALALAIAAAPGVELQISHRAVAVEGGRLALYRYSPPGGGASHPPVLLLADVGFGRPLFDFGRKGLARWLASRGFVVYVGELRGQGNASPSTTLAAVVSEELPALVAAVEKDHPGPIDLVAHGWLGTLALAATSQELKGQVRRVVSLDTPAIAEVPSELVASFLEGGGHFGELSSRGAEFELLFAMGGQFSHHTLGPFRTTARDLSPAISSALLDWMRSGELTLADGSTVRARLASYDRPTLQLLGIADGFSNAELCSPLRDVSKAKVQVRAFSRFLNAEDYSHVSLLLGGGAPRDVFPLIEGFLAADPVTAL